MVGVVLKKTNVAVLACETCVVEKNDGKKVTVVVGVALQGNKWHQQ